MALIETNDDKKARAIVDGLLGRPTDDYPQEIELSVFNVVYSLLDQEGHQPAVSILLSGNLALCQFTNISPDYFRIRSKDNIGVENFTFIKSRYIRIVPQFRESWRTTILNDLVQYKVWSLLVLAISFSLFALQKISDMHGYFTIVAQVLALVFTLYTIFRSSSMSADKFDMMWFESGYLNRVVQRDTVIGVNAVLTIFTCLFGILITTPSIAQIGHSVLDHYTVLYWPARLMPALVGTALSELLLLILCALAFYYPDRRRNEAQIYGSRLWFTQRYQEGQPSRLHPELRSKGNGSGHQH